MPLEQFKQEIKSYCEQLKKNFKEDFQSLMNNKEDKPPISIKNYSVVVPLPKEILVQEKVEMLHGSFYVTIEVKCGLRIFTTQYYLGELVDQNVIDIEIKRCVDCAIQQCLKYDRGQICELSDSGKVVNIQSL